MIRRPLWNRGGGVFVEETGWNAVVAVRDTEGDASSPVAVAAPAADEVAAPAQQLRKAGLQDGDGRWLRIRIVTNAG